jgi:hypothetical protein
MYKEEATSETKFTEWDCYLKGGSIKTVKTKPTALNKIMPVIEKQEGFKKGELIGVQAILNNETK